ncbi:MULTISPECIES: alpha/beta fold hydrolase [Kitasatospora]|uniref:alpha/beta fold hydrolase n=1 Tax=Kitasatospora TaxID=2063 RepID=UPI002284266E|nr:alpha/beta fold hydrolase [Kitasatospora sp. YST-16]WAL73372.1 alpha/beta fold hydrolase [Kitasatospora sp. YST-16]WNW39428.1 alpha/beta fold hydrolase [Streptomyces sp. Li-HN-5-13]
MATRRIETPDGGVLAVETSGDPSGHPVFLLHGTPGSRVGPAPRGAVLARMRVRLISFDRPGYGDSTRLPGRDVAAAATDVTVIADALGLDRFSVVGRSGGGPHALACAALLPDRVRRAATQVSLAPRHADGLDWFEGMTPSNEHAYRQAELGQPRIAGQFQVRSRVIRRDPAQLIRNLVPELTPPDRTVVADIGIRRILHSTYRQAFRYGADGWIDDVLAFIADWGFAVESIRAPVRLWHGAEDRFSPVGHSAWLADHIPGAQLYLEPGAAHFGALKEMTDAIRWAAHA